MKSCELAGTYLRQYEDTDVTITGERSFNITGVEGDCKNPVAFDLSDGTHWFSDDNATGQVANSLVDVEDIGWNDADGWVILEGGKEKPITWID